ncbi:hypothetical protein Syn7502_02434 [Synechococcus sp. PCC 7502]|uniref:hypothetical protein n=1 Tax=Synechococcus sp. PCC 7502 TaxID=1173263 RepID=UPI00029F95C5|nr:hypothetical protein [Synechococcus sp. PCC 7502]AFY74418.1 hypothetical protein Syn7502_02434 [Synechococcus sp. PCC 7502]
MTQLGEVFGIAASVPKHTYVDRAGLDGRFTYLVKQDRHIVIHGASKQGKTILRKKNLPENQSIVVQCGANSGRDLIYLEILRKLGSQIPTEVSKKLTLGAELQGKASSQLNIPFVGSAEVETNGSGSVERELGTLLSPIGIAPESIGFIAQEIKQSNKIVVIEDFHYLSEQEKINLAFDLKAFWDSQVFFIIIGIWADQNLLTYYNGDLSGRVEEIDIRWSLEELDQVLQKGSRVLNISFNPDIQAEIIDDANQNVGLLQRVAEKYCYESKIYESSLKKQFLNNRDPLTKARTSICSEEAVRYQLFDDVVSRGLRDSGESELKVYQRIVRVCVEASSQDLRDGISRADLLTRVQAYEPRVRLSDLSAALNKIDKLQAVRSISPLILSYNPNTQKIQLVDREFLFYRKYANPSWSWEETDG